MPKSANQKTKLLHLACVIDIILEKLKAPVRQTVSDRLQ